MMARTKHGLCFNLIITSMTRSLNVTNKTVANCIHVYEMLSKCHDKTVANYMCMTRSLNVINKTVANYIHVYEMFSKCHDKTVANYMIVDDSFSKCHEQNCGQLYPCV